MHPIDFDYHFQKYLLLSFFIFAGLIASFVKFKNARQETTEGTEAFIEIEEVGEELPETVALTITEITESDSSVYVLEHSG